MEASGFEVVHSEVVGFVPSIDLGRVGPEPLTNSDAGPTGRRRTPSSCGRHWASMPVVERLESELRPAGAGEQRR